MNRLATINEIQTELTKLASQKTFAQAQRVILSVVRLLDNSISLDDQRLFQLFADSDGKIRANGSWFFEDQTIVDRKATYKIHSDNKLNIDFKLYGIAKPSKRTIAWVQALTPNFEDEPFNSKFNLGIDFVVPKSADRVIIVLSNQYVIRTLELKGSLTATYQEILSKWAQIIDFSNKKEVHSFLWDSFDLQPLNKKFYAGISERFILLRQHLTKENILDDKHSSFFANRLIGRVIFCWFLDKKGVINPDRKYFDSQSFESDTDYYRKNLEALFYGVLNTPIPDREYKDDVTPFLNGGLFEARESDLYKNSKLTFPKNYFNDLFGFLSGYNFTTDESTSQFQQVAIDPEMLGRIFENLLAEMTEETGEQARKAKGAFYTPREIVDYMCRESLREYLKTKIPEDEFRDKRFAQLIDAPDKDFQDQDHNWRRDWKPYKDAIIEALDELKVLDPACGSGAFPIGMLQLLVRVYERLEPRFDTYKAKLQIIEKNIYGADIEPMAVEIARLRAWLSIIVDEEADSKNIKPLPNLEFKFICANSLIDLDKDGTATLSEDTDLDNKLQEIRDAYFNSESLSKKKKLRLDYDKLIHTSESLFGESLRSKQLKTYRPFDNEWSATFFNPEFMFGIPSFEIVIGNPPYLRIQGLQKTQAEMIPMYRRDYQSAQGSFDLYALFIEKGFSLLGNDGQLVYIVPHKFFQASFGKKLRSIITAKKALNQIVKFGAEQVFENPTTYTCLLFLSTRPRDKFRYTEVTSMKDLAETMSAVSDQRESLNVVRNVLSAPSGDEWNFQVGKTGEVLQTLNQQPQKLGDVVEKIFQGIATSSDKIYVLKILQEKEKTVCLFSASLQQEFEIERGLLRPFLMGKNVHRYQEPVPKNYVIFPYHEKEGKMVLMTVDYIQKNFPMGWNYLIHNQKELENREKGRMRHDSFYAYIYPKNLNLYHLPKIMTPEIALGGQMTFDGSGVAHTTKVYSFVFKENLPENLKYWLGLLNSKILWYFLSNTGYVLRGGYFTFKTNYLTPSPVKRIDFKNKAEKEAHDQIVKLVDTILLKKKSDEHSDTLEYEAQIDRLVYELYGLTPDEIKSVEAK